MFGLTTTEKTWDRPRYWTC